MRTSGVDDVVMYCGLLEVMHVNLPQTVENIASRIKNRYLLTINTIRVTVKSFDLLGHQSLWIQFSAF